MKKITLKDLTIGQKAIIREINGKGAIRQHLLDMGVIPQADISIVKFAPMGDPVEVRIHGYELTLRLQEAEQIIVDPIEIEAFKEAEKKEQKAARRSKIAHPGLGEGGKFHPKGSGEELPEGTQLTFALVGNQNCGKTTLFNQLTGSNQRV